MSVRSRATVGQSVSRQSVGVGGVLQATQCRSGRQQHGRLDIVQDEGEPVRRPRRIEWHVCAAGLENGEQADHHLDRALEAQRHRNTGSDAASAEMVRELIGPAIQLRIRDRVGAEPDGLGFRMPGRVRLEQLLNARLGREGDCRGVPVDEHLPPLGLGQQRQQRHLAPGIGGDGVEQRKIVPEQSRAGGFVEQVAAVLERAPQAVAVLDDLQHDVELGAAGIDADRRRLQPGQREPGFAPIQREGDLEHRRATHVARQLQRLDDLLERRRLMVVEVERDLLDALQQLVEGDFARHVQPQRQRIGEEADQILELGTAPPSSWRSHHDVGLVAVAVQQHRESRQRGHEERRPGVGAEGPEPGGQVAIDVGGLAAAAEALHGRSRSIERQP